MRSDCQSHDPSLQPSSHRSSTFEQSNVFLPSRSLTSLCSWHIHWEKTSLLAVLGGWVFRLQGEELGSRCHHIISPLSKMYRIPLRGFQVRIDPLPDCWWNLSLQLTTNLPQKLNTLSFSASQASQHVHACTIWQALLWHFCHTTHSSVCKNTHDQLSTHKMRNLVKGSSTCAYEELDAQWVVLRPWNKQKAHKERRENEKQQITFALLTMIPWHALTPTTHLA